MAETKCEVLIRTANGTDAAELKKLIGFFNGDEESCNTVSAIEESFINNNREVVFVADDGRNLVGFCCGQIQTSMCYFHLSTDKDNTAALALYHSCGYKDSSIMLEKDLQEK
jgi:hypothetical protein